MYSELLEQSPGNIPASRSSFVFLPFQRSAGDSDTRARRTMLESFERFGRGLSELDTGRKHKGSEGVRAFDTGVAVS